MILNFILLRAPKYYTMYNRRGPRPIMGLQSITIAIFPALISFDRSPQLLRDQYTGPVKPHEVGELQSQLGPIKLHFDLSLTPA